jgi:hypothetical protein
MAVERPERTRAASSLVRSQVHGGHFHVVSWRGQADDGGHVPYRQAHAWSGPLLAQTRTLSVSRPE